MLQKIPESHRIMRLLILSPTTSLSGKSGGLYRRVDRWIFPGGGEFDIAYLRMFPFNTKNMGNIESGANIKEGDLTLGIAPTIRHFNKGGCQIPTMSPL